MYLDASALVKRYVAERGSRETADLCAKADIVATSLVSRAEVAAALAKAVRVGIVEPDKGRKAQRAFASQWPDFAKVPVTEALVARAEALAWDSALRGYDAVQLASALTWQESVGAEVTLATFDPPALGRRKAGGDSRLAGDVEELADRLPFDRGSDNRMADGPAGAVASSRRNTARHAPDSGLAPTKPTASTAWTPRQDASR